METFFLEEFRARPAFRGQHGAEHINKMSLRVPGNFGVYQFVCASNPINNANSARDLA